MLRSVLGAILSMAAISQVAGQELHVRTVDLKGDPITGIEVKILDVENQSDSNGIVKFGVRDPVDSGAFDIRVNLKSDFGQDRVSSYYIGRVKKVRWDNEERFFSGFVIPLWKLNDVKSLGTAVVKNPDHYAVVLQYDKNDVSSTRVVASYEGSGDVDTWIEQWVPDLPAVSSPKLARELAERVEPGLTLPQRYAGEMAYVYSEVDKLKRAARICRRFPGRAEMPRPPQPRPPQPQPPQEPIRQVVRTPIMFPGKVFIENQGNCAFNLLVNNQLVSVPAGNATTVPAFVGTVITRLPNQPDIKSWTHWREKNGEYILHLYARSILRNRLQWKTGAYSTNADGVPTWRRGGLSWTPECNIQLTADAECVPDAAPARRDLGIPAPYGPRPAPPGERSPIGSYGPQ